MAEHSREPPNPARPRENRGTGRASGSNGRQVRLGAPSLARPSPATWPGRGQRPGHCAARAGRAPRRAPLAELSGEQGERAVLEVNWADLLRPEPSARRAATLPDGDQRPAGPQRGGRRGLGAPLSLGAPRRAAGAVLLSFAVCFGKALPAAGLPALLVLAWRSAHSASRTAGCGSGARSSGPCRGVSTARGPGADEAGSLDNRYFTSGASRRGPCSRPRPRRSVSTRPTSSTSSTSAPSGTSA